MRIWCDRGFSDEKPLWIAEDGQSAILYKRGAIERLQVKAPSKTLLPSGISPPPIEVAVSRDDAVLAWTDGTQVRWIQNGSPP